MVIIQSVKNALKLILLKYTGMQVAPPKKIAKAIKGLLTGLKNARMVRLEAVKPQNAVVLHTMKIATATLKANMKMEELAMLLIKLLLIGDLQMVIIQSVTNALWAALALKYTGMQIAPPKKIAKAIKGLLMGLKNVEPDTTRWEPLLNAAALFTVQSAPTPATMSYKQVIALKTKHLLRVAAIITKLNLANVWTINRISLSHHKGWFSTLFLI